MKKNDTVFLNHILEALNYIQDYISDQNYETFLRRRIVQDAIVRRLEIVGEAAYNLSENLKEQYPEISWHEIIGMRNRLIHAYFDVALEVVWDIVNHDVPRLKKQIETAIKLIDESRD